MSTNNKRYLRYYNSSKGHFIVYPVMAIYHEEFCELLLFIREQPIIKNFSWEQFKESLSATENTDIKQIFSLLMSYIPTRPNGISWLDFPDFFLFLEEIWELHQIQAPPPIEDDDFLEIPSSGSHYDDFMASLIKSFSVEGTIALINNFNYQSVINLHWRHAYLGRDPDKIKEEMTRRNMQKIFSNPKELAAWSAALGFKK